VEITYNDIDNEGVSAKKKRKEKETRRRNKKEKKEKKEKKKKEKRIKKREESRKTFIDGPALSGVEWLTAMFHHDVIRVTPPTHALNIPDTEDLRRVKKRRACV